MVIIRSVLKCFFKADALDGVVTGVQSKDGPLAAYFGIDVDGRALYSFPIAVLSDFVVLTNGCLDAIVGSERVG